MPRVVFDPNITPGELAQAAVILLHRMRDVLGPTTVGDCETAIRRVNQAFELHAVFRQTLDKLPAGFVAVTNRSVIRRSDIEASGRLALTAIKTLRRALREKCREHFKYESGMDGWS